MLYDAISHGYPVRRLLGAEGASSSAAAIDAYFVTIVPHSILRCIPRAMRTASIIARLLVIGPSAAAAQTADVTGLITTVWFDGVRPSVPSGMMHIITTATGEVVAVRLDPALIARAGGERALQGRQVRVSGTTVQATSARPGVPLASRSIRATGLQLLGAGPGNPPQAARAARPPSAYITLLCKVADSVDVEPRSKAQYETMFLGAQYPDIHHYWPSITDGYVVTDGSQVAGWFILPHPKSYYSRTKPDGSPDPSTPLGTILDDCMSAADADVDFSQVAGINFQINAWWDVATGGMGVLSKDGPARVVGMTTLPSWATPFVYAHEMGHSFGLPHSATQYDASYGGFFDVMSQGRFWDASLPDEVPSGTIGYHQWRLGNLTSEDLLIPTPATRQTIQLDILNTPSRAGTGDRMVIMPLGGIRYYTLEARRESGPYEQWIPASGVLLFAVDTAPTPDRDWVPARIVDADHNGNPNDAGAVWTPGEAWTDPANGYSFTVLAETSTGYTVSIRRGFAATVTIHGPGAVATPTTSCNTSPCEFLTADANTPLSLAATPAADEQFLGWTGSCVGISTSCSLSLSHDDTLTAVFGRPIVVTQPPRATGVAGQSFADTLHATGGVDGLTWEIASGALPSGLTLNPATGVISGIPTTASVVNLSLRCRSFTLSATTSLSLEIEAQLTVASSAARPTAIVGVAYADTLHALGGSLNGSHWQISSGKLPPGIALSMAGQLSGTPTTAGDYQATVTVASVAQHAEQSFDWHVVDGVHIVAGTTRRAGTMGAAYRDTLRVDGDFPVRWTIVGEGLPPGVALDTTTGILSGIPERTGDFAFSARAALRSPNLGNAEPSFDLTMHVGAPSVTVDAVIDQLLNKKALAPDVLRYFDLLGNRNGRLDVGDIAAWLEVTGQSAHSSASVIGSLLATPPGDRR